MNKTNNDRNSLAHTVWNCKYHIVFAPKYRIKVFFEENKESDQLCIFDPRDSFTGSKQNNAQQAGQ